MRGKTGGAIAGTALAVALCAIGPAVTGADTTVRISTTFTTTGEHDYTVPAGVTGLIVTASGGSGQTVNGVAGGDGALITAHIAVTGGEKLYLYVDVGGGAPGSAGVFQAGEPGGRGGGESDVRMCAEAATGCGALGSEADPRLLVAAGGGGAAGYAGSQGGTAGAGASPCAPGKAGAADGVSGLGASCTAAGRRGPVPNIPYVGTDGGPGEGGTGGVGYPTEAAGAASNIICSLSYNGGGGGGAGYFGGGGGDAGCADGGGGGGGGSSYVATVAGPPPAGRNIVVSGATITSAHGHAASVTVGHDELAGSARASSSAFPWWAIPVGLAIVVAVTAAVVRRQRRPPTA